VETVCELPLRGAGGEPISFARTVHSHGCARLPPAQVEESPLIYHRALRIGKRVVVLSMRERDGKLIVETKARLRQGEAKTAGAAVVRMFRLDDDLSPFYAQIAHDEGLRWAAAGAGRILASPTVFEDVIKTICTTNCAWSGTIRMTQALADLGGGAFPGAELLAAAPESWFREVARMGYRGAYVRAIATDVAGGVLDLESLRSTERYGDEDVEERLLALPGIGTVWRRARHAASRAASGADL
jgi:N-glycosylase/DNA lyase